MALVLLEEAARVPPQSNQAGDTQTGEQLHERRSHTVVKFLDCPGWEIQQVAWE